MRSILISILLIIAATTISVIQTSGQTYNFREYNVEHGLAQSQVLALHLDSKGYLWIGTNGGGVNIFDGKNFNLFTEDDGLAGNRVMTITEDKNGNIWLGTNKGISVYNGQKIQNYSTEDGLSHNSIRKIFIDKRTNIIWIGTDKGVVTFIDNEFEIIDIIGTLNNAMVLSIFIDNLNNIWFGTFRKGLYKYDFKKVEVFNTLNNLYNNNVRTIIQDTTGNIWICTDRGINLYKNNKIIKYIFPNKIPIAPSSVMLSKNKDVWFTTFKGSILCFPKSNDYENFGSVIRLKQAYYWTMIEDNENNFWIGTDSGLLRFSQDIKFFNYNEKHNLVYDNIYSICETKDQMFWFGSSKEGASKMKFITDRTAKITNYKRIHDSPNQIVGSRIFSIIEDRNKNIWFGTWNGLSKFVPEDSIFYNFSPANKNQRSKDIYYTKTPELVSPYINCLYEDIEGKIWVGTQNGVSVITDTGFVNFNREFNEFEGKVIYNIFADSSKHLWFATDSGAYLYNGHTVRHFGKKDGFVDDRVNSVAQDNRGFFWFGTKEGVFRYNYSTFSRIDKKSGLTSNNIYLIIFDDYHNLFIGTDKGIDKFDTRTYNITGEVKIRHFGDKEGFIGQECNLNACYKDSKGRLWFGTIKGVTIYDPKYDKLNTLVPKTYITKLQQAYQDFDWSPYCDSLDPETFLPVNLVLPYNKNHLSFEFAALSLTIPEKVRYQIMLEGLDDDWFPPRSKNDAEYPSLPPGKYTFKVKACNNDGLWNDTPATFSFIIKPPFWQTAWFYTIVAVVSLILIYSYIKRREANLKREKIILEDKVRERTRELQEQKEIVEEKNKDITDSINYAKNIQSAIIPSVEEFESKFPNSLVLFKPRDIVSGDFYWMKHINRKTYFTAADCTGHGVPGAFMSMLGIAFLDEIVNINPDIEAHNLLNMLRQNVIKALHQTGKEGESKDGMDMAMCVIDWDKQELQYSGANNPLYLIRNEEFTEIKPDKMPIGYYLNQQDFTNNRIPVYPEDTIFVFSDGFPDQFGGPKGKKFKSRQFKELLKQINGKSMVEQRDILDKTIIDWMGTEHEQIDDILVIGVRFKEEHFK